jgi:hypothetical protein
MESGFVREMWEPPLSNPGSRHPDQVGKLSSEQGGDRSRSAQPCGALTEVLRGLLRWREGLYMSTAAEDRMGPSAKNGG